MKNATRVLKTPYIAGVTTTKAKLETFLGRKVDTYKLPDSAIAMLKQKSNVKRVQVVNITRTERNRLARLEVVPFSINGHLSSQNQINYPVTKAVITDMVTDLFTFPNQPKLTEKTFNVVNVEVRKYAKNNNHGNSPLMEKTRIVRKHRKGTRMFYAINIYNSVKNPDTLKRSEMIAKLFTVFTEQFDNTSKKQATIYARHVRNELGIDYCNG